MKKKKPIKEEFCFEGTAEKDDKISDRNCILIICVVLFVVFCIGFAVGKLNERHSDNKKTSNCEANPCTFDCARANGHLYDDLGIKCEGVKEKSLETLLAPL